MQTAGFSGQKAALVLVICHSAMMAYENCLARVFHVTYLFDHYAALCLREVVRLSASFYLMAAMMMMDLELTQAFALIARLARF